MQLSNPGIVLASQVHVIIKNLHSPECLVLIHLKLKTDTIMQLNEPEKEKEKETRVIVIFPAQTAILPSPEICSNQEGERNCMCM